MAVPPIRRGRMAVPRTRRARMAVPQAERLRAAVMAIVRQAERRVRADLAAEPPAEWAETAAAAAGRN